MEAREEHLVFDADMAGQIAGELGNAVIERAPPGGGVHWRAKGQDELLQHFKLVIVSVVLSAQYFDRLPPHGIAAPGKHGEKDTLFHLHVRFQAFGHLRQEIRKTVQGFGTVLLGALELPRKFDEPRQLLPVNLMIALDNEGYDAASVVGRRRSLFQGAGRSMGVTWDLALKGVAQKAERPWENPLQI